MILVVDDDKVMTVLSKRFLGEAGYEVRVSHNGEEAYKELQDPKCKSMLLDIQMPGINGAELLMLMTTEDIDVPVIVMTSFADFDAEEMKQFPHVKTFFHKPLYPEEVLAAVQKYAKKA